MRKLHLLLILLVGFNFSVKANPSCSEASVQIKNSKLQKIMIKWIDKKKTKIKFLYNEKIISANPFFCYQRKGFKECLGDDDSGHLIIKNNKLKIKRLTIRTADDHHHQIKEIRKGFSLKKVSCNQNSKK